MSLQLGNNLNLFFPLKIYGAAVTFFELLPEEQLTEERKEALKLNDDEVWTQFVMVVLKAA